MDSKIITAHLNSRVLCRIAPSKTHGVGVFAIRNIAEGEKLSLDVFPQPFKLSAEDFKSLNEEVREVILERNPTALSGSAFMYPDVRQVAYMNHSEEPNYDAILDIAIKPIKKGEEITEDYRKISGWEKVFTWLVDKK